MGREGLTWREQEILRLIARGLSDRAIADDLILTVGTVKWYNRQIYSKLHVSNRMEAIAESQRLGLLQSTSPHVDAPSPTPPKHNLPAHVTSFIGRSAERAEIKQMLKTTRFLTLTGPPGTGKTRLAQAAASDSLTAFKDGVFFVSLAPIADSTLVVNSIAQVLGSGEQGNESILDAVKRHLVNRSILLVLDNFEHLLEAAPLVSELLMSAPRLSVLVTSRETLHLYGEQEYPVAPLQLPDLKQALEKVIAEPSESLELFLQRAKAALPTFQLTLENVASAAAICIHVDGLPLAIELAAAQIKFYAPQNLLVRLSSRLEALGVGPRDLPARQRTLRATLAWSYDLLTADERRLFARLGIFAGGFSIDDVEAVCADMRGMDVMAGIESLSNKSLLRQMPGADHEPRFMMLEMMREYALEKLNATGEIAYIRERHAAHFMELAERAEREMTGSGEAEWLSRLEVEHDNLRAALQFFLSVDDEGQSSQRLASKLRRFWLARGYHSEGRMWFSEVLRLNSVGAPSKIRAAVLTGAGNIAYMQCDYSSARQFYLEAIDIQKTIDDQRGLAWTLSGLADVETALGSHDMAEPIYLQAADLMRRISDMDGLGFTYSLLAWSLMRSRGDYVQAAAWLEQSLTIYREAGIVGGMALAASGLGEIAIRQGELERAAQLLEQSLKGRQEIGEMWGISASLGSLGWLSLRQGNFGHATHLLCQSLLIRKDLGDPGGMAWCLEKLAEIALLQKDDGRAARIFGAAAALRASTNSIIDLIDQPEYERMLAKICAQLGDEVYEAVWAEGQAMNRDQIIQYVFPATL